jgi:hypothetical protein
LIKAGMFYQRRILKKLHCQRMSFHLGKNNQIMMLAVTTRSTPYATLPSQNLRLWTTIKNWNRLQAIFCQLHYKEL